MLEVIKKFGLDRGVVVTPDVGSIKLARSYAAALHWDLAIVDKSRINAELVQANVLIGDVKDRHVLLVDDMCSTGETLNQASWVCKRAGAKRIFAAVTHGLIVGTGFLESAIERMLISNTVPLPSDCIRDRLEVVSVANLFGHAIESIVLAGSISTQYK
jgi:ribose-phosphate pyrophosphokinase